ncbi:MAG: peptidylprolyl isomerase [Planctomycetota bacterium]
MLFQTNAGDFQVELNPTGNSNLQPLVDNFLAYVTSDRWVGAVINRAASTFTGDPFVVQLGGFRADSIKAADVPFGGLPGVPTFDPVVVDADLDGTIDFDTTGLSNTRGEVALALSAGNPNSGTSSWFVNLSDNSFLDAQGFVPFARIPDLSFFDDLESGPQLDLSTQVGQPSSLAYTDVPVVNGGEDLVVIEGVVVVPEPAALVLAFVATAVGACRRR